MKQKKILGWKQVLILILGIAFIVPVLTQYINIRNQYTSEKREIEKLKKDNEYLANLLKETNSPYFVEKIAREQMGLMKDGEYLVKINPAPKIQKKCFPLNLLEKIWKF